MEFNVTVAEAGPYVWRKSDGNITGKFVHVLKRLLVTCCGDDGRDAQLNFKMVENQYNVVANMGESEHIAMPFTRMMGFESDLDDTGATFLPVMPSPGKETTPKI